jgi:hypothetical protein
MTIRFLLLALVLAAQPLTLDAQESGKPAATKGGGKSGGKSPAQKRPRAKRVRAKDRSVQEKTTVARPAPATSATSATTPARNAEAPAPSLPAEVSAPRSADAAALSSDADEAVRKEGDSEIKTVEFGGLDIEGQLKSPQMLYFLNRLRAEFNRPELPHRSFMPELQRGTTEKAFR